MFMNKNDWDGLCIKSTFWMTCKLLNPFDSFDPFDQFPLWLYAIFNNYPFDPLEKT